jgi:hypothetical protein
MSRLLRGYPAIQLLCKSNKLYSSRPHSDESVSLGGDLLAGVTLAAMLIPQSVSYGTALAKLSPATGLVRLLVSFPVPFPHVHLFYPSSLPLFPR